jgi:integrase
MGIMASLRKRGEFWYYRFMDSTGTQVERKGYRDKKATQALARDAEKESEDIRRGRITPKDLALTSHENRSLADHIADWQADLVAKGFTPKHAEHTSNRARRLIAVILNSDLALRDHRRLPPNDRGEFIRKIAEHIEPARLSDLTREKVQAAIARFKDAGWSLQTCNHYRASLKAFSKWCYDSDRTRDDFLHGVTGFNAKEDPRHDRRTISLAEFHLLIDAAQRGGDYHGMSGPARALCYRTAASTGIRISELSTTTPESFDWNAPSVIVQACYTKNGQTATLYLPSDLVSDLRAYVATIEPGKPVFPLPEGKGARVIRRDLKAAGIPYQDAAGKFFDFHSLRCELATLADAAGVSPRVTQKMMRASSLELVSLYTRPRVVDIEAGVSSLPSLKPGEDKPQILAITGTEG